MNMESNMTAIGKRHAVVTDYQLTIDDNGTIVKLKNDFIEDYGCSMNERVIDGSTEFFRNCYNTRGWEINAKEALTDSASNTWY
jgi:xanthine dehydrogenase/oxidase